MKKLLGIMGAAALVVVMLAGVSRAETLQIKGSDTLINLVQRLAEVYMEQNPGAYIAVTGGGSGTGIAALINGKCDIANASRTMKEKEVKQAQDRRVDPKRVVIAMDGLSVIVNPDNTVDELTMDQIGKIFRGEITNWQEVGGKNMPIALYGRQSNSGTFVYFMDSVLKSDYSPKMRRMNGNSQIVEAVRSDASAIGYVGVGYIVDAPDIQVVKVSARKGSAYASPLNKFDVESGKYPIARPLNQYVDGKPSPEVLDFIKFELGPDGQAIVDEMGFFPIPNEYKEFNSKVAGN